MEVIQANILSDKHYQGKRKNSSLNIKIPPNLQNRPSEFPILHFKITPENSRIKRCDTILMFLSLWSLSFCNHAQGCLKSQGESPNFAM